MSDAIRTHTRETYRKSATYIRKLVFQETQKKLTPCDRVIIETLIFAELVKNYETRSLIKVSTRIRYCVRHEPVESSP
jgi:hypothetical protein